MTDRRRHHTSLACIAVLVVYLSQVDGISVSFGTSGGPIVPPTPSPPTPPPQPPFRAPAPVWEDNTDDIPNPNPYKAPVPPQLAHLFKKNPPPTPSTSTVRPAGTHTRYTNIGYQPKPALPVPASTVSAAKSFVQAYAPSTTTTKSPPTQSTPAAQNTNTDRSRVDQHDDSNYQRLDNKDETFRSYSQPQPVLGFVNVPGFGFRYITPEQDRDPRKYYNSRYQHDQYNAIDSNTVFGQREHPHDLDLTYEKYLVQKDKRSPTHQTYVNHQPYQYYHHQLFYPVH